MKKKKQVLWLTQAAVIAALYAALTVAQSLIAPGTASMAVQFRVSEAMTLLCCITPAAIPGLTLGCFLANFLFMDALPVDMILGSLATLLAGLAMYALRKVQWKKLPLLAALMPAIFNGIIIGLEIEIFFISSMEDNCRIFLINGVSSVRIRFFSYGDAYYIGSLVVHRYG